MISRTTHPNYNPALRALRYHVSGAIARGEAEPIVAQEAPRVDSVHGHACTCHTCRKDR